MSFSTMVAAKSWLKWNAQGPCTVVCHADPYLCWETGGLWMMERQYTASFYMRGNR